MQARLARFYGWGYQEMQAMPWSKVIEFFTCINMLQAQETGVDINIASYPHMKQSARKKYFELIKRESTKNLSKPKRSVLDAALELAKRMSGHG